MMRALIGCLLTSIGLGGTAFAEEPPMSAYFGNTLACSGPSMECHIWFKSDGTYRRFQATVDGNGNLKLVGIDGRYEITPKGTSYETCLMPRAIGGPMGNGTTECYVLAGYKVGDRWQVTGPGGAPLQFALISGHRVNDGLDFLE